MVKISYKISGYAKHNSKKVYCSQPCYSCFLPLQMVKLMIVLLLLIKCAHPDLISPILLSKMQRWNCLWTDQPLALPTLVKVWWALLLSLDMKPCSVVNYLHITLHKQLNWLPLQKPVNWLRAKL